MLSPDNLKQETSTLKKSLIGLKKQLGITTDQAYQKNAVPIGRFFSEKILGLLLYYPISNKGKLLLDKHGR